MHKKKREANLPSSFLMSDVELFNYVSYPLKELIKSIVSTVGSVPSQQKVHVLTDVLEFCGEINRDREGCVAVLGTMTYIPMRCYGCIAVTDETHRVHQLYIPMDIIGNDGIILMGGEVSVIHFAASPVPELIILPTGIVDAIN